jgi:hypothetical protein
VAVAVTAVAVTDKIQMIIGMVTAYTAVAVAEMLVVHHTVALAVAVAVAIAVLTMHLVTDGIILAVEAVEAHQAQFLAVEAEAEAVEAIVLTQAMEQQAHLVQVEQEEF